MLSNTMITIKGKRYTTGRLKLAYSEHVRCYLAYDTRHVRLTINGPSSCSRVHTDPNNLQFLPAS